jgi:hypothetical protein
MKSRPYSKTHRRQLGTQIGLFATAVFVAIITGVNASEVAYEFVVLGLIGAIFAHSTGAGGGVVSIPTVHQLGLNESAAVATRVAV